MALCFLVAFASSLFATAIASGKNRNVAVYAILGFWLPLLGVLLALAAEKQEPKEAVQ